MQQTHSFDSKITFSTFIFLYIIWICLISHSISFENALIKSLYSLCGQITGCRFLCSETQNLDLVKVGEQQQQQPLLEVAKYTPWVWTPFQVQGEEVCVCALCFVCMCVCVHSERITEQSRSSTPFLLACSFWGFNHSGCPICGCNHLKCQQDPSLQLLAAKVT